MTTEADPQDGQDGDNGSNGAAGDTVATGRVYYQTLQSSSPSAPSASGFNFSTGLLTGLSSGWAQTQPSVDITDTSVQEWSASFTATKDGGTGTVTVSFGSVTGAIQVTTDIESDNFVSGSSGWQIQRDTGTAEFGSASIRGTLTANQIQIDNVTLDSDGSGNLIIKDGGVTGTQIGTGSNGVGTTNVVSRAITDQSAFSQGSTTLTSTGSITLGSFTTTEASQFLLLDGSCNVYGTGTGLSYSLGLTINGTTVALFLNSVDDDYANYNALRFSTATGAKIVVAGSGSHTIGLSYVIASGSSLKVTRLRSVVTLLKR